MLIIRNVKVTIKRIKRIAKRDNNDIQQTHDNNDEMEK